MAINLGLSGGPRMKICTAEVYLLSGLVVLVVLDLGNSVYCVLSVSTYLAPYLPQSA